MKKITFGFIILFAFLVVMGQLMFSQMQLKLAPAPPQSLQIDSLKPLTETITSPIELVDDVTATLNSLEQIDGYPLYVMHYYGQYEPPAVAVNTERNLLQAYNAQNANSAWGCSLFTALADPENRLYGRNFDWQYSPALLLFTHPPNGYASVSMVDMEYLDIPPNDLDRLTDLPLSARKPLLDAPRIPFDGMNEYGLTIAMAAVPDTDLPFNPQKETIGSIGIMRQVLDKARNIDEALTIMESYNIKIYGGPSLHYLLADSSGRSVLVEFYNGKMIVQPNDQNWHLATNFLDIEQRPSFSGADWRYQIMNDRLPAQKGKLTAEEAIKLLADVAQANTQWSVVYQMSSGDISVAMGQNYDKVYNFNLPLVK